MKKLAAFGQISILLISAVALTSCGQIVDQNLTMNSGFLPQVGISTKLPIKAKPFSFFAIDDFNKFDSLKSQVEQLLQEADLHQDLSLNQTTVEARKDNLYTVKYQYALQGIPVCNLQTLVHENARGDSHIISQIPELEDTTLPQSWSDLDDDMKAASDAIAENLIEVEGFKLIQNDSCLLVDENKLKAARILLVEVNSMPYQVTVTEGDVTNIEKKFFSATGTAEVYEKNPSDGTMKSFTLNNLVDSNNYLENQYFTTSTTGTKAEESSRTYNYSTSDERFDEVSAFVHTNEQYNWFVGKGHSWSSSDKLNITVHAVVGGTVNNALYTPGNGGSAPKIEIGDGDGSVLTNLPKDSDVSAHELGHHIIYDNITSTSGESLVLHEGLADYFTLARTGDSCLGESICPAGSSLCAVESQCLRTADNNYVLDVNTRSEPHLKSQFISGMLWDLRGNAVPADNLDQIVYNATRLMLGSSGYHDFILTMLIAEKNLYSGEYCDAIYKKAQDRGLTSAIADFDCSSSNLSIASRDNSGATITSTESSTESSGGGFFGCGVATGDRAKSSPLSSIFILFILIGLPMLAVGFRAKFKHRLSETA